MNMKSHHRSAVFLYAVPIAFFLVCLIGLFTLYKHQSGLRGLKPVNISTEPEIWAIAERDQIGNALADWANANCTLISINDKPITVQGVNSGGCSPIGYSDKQLGSIVVFDKEEMLSDNMQILLDTSQCDKQELLAYVVALSSEKTKKELAHELTCLGKFEFTDGDFFTE